LLNKNQVKLLVFMPDSFAFRIYLIKASSWLIELSGFILPVVETLPLDHTDATIRFERLIDHTETVLSRRIWVWLACAHDVFQQPVK
jgi:hypothetical protein